MMTLNKLPTSRNQATNAPVGIAILRGIIVKGSPEITDKSIDVASICCAIDREYSARTSVSDPILDWD
jgi:hypothetical protein